MSQCPQPSCASIDTSVIDSRPLDQAVRRRRKCNVCGRRWSTYEVSAEAYAALTGLRPDALDAAVVAVAAAAEAVTNLRDQAAIYREAQAGNAVSAPQAKP